jgi:LAO/AO transport system kinase
MKAIDILKGIKKGDIGILSKAITLVESTISSDRIKANKLIDLCLKERKETKKICISGPPGVGKSTFINQLGFYLLNNKKRIAVLAIDPSSKKSNGSILADKTRMSDISSHKNVFIRPSPSSGSLGGINSATRESVILCEAFGFDVIIIETVGVGQNEIDGYSISDCYILLTLPKSGDQIQAIKKGILEFADFIIIHKSDLISKVELVKEKNYYLETFNNKKIVESFSSIKKTEIGTIWKKIKNHSSKKDLINKQMKLLHEAIKEELKYKFYKDSEVQIQINRYERNKLDGLNIKKIAKKLVENFLK